MKNLEAPSPNEDHYAELSERVERAMRQCARDVLIRHKREGFPIVSMRDGKVVLIPPEQIVIPPEE